MADVVTTDCTVVEQYWRALAVRVSMTEFNPNVSKANMPLTIQTFWKFLNIKIRL